MLKREASASTPTTDEQAARLVGQINQTVTEVRSVAEAAQRAANDISAETRAQIEAMTARISEAETALAEFNRTRTLAAANDNEPSAARQAFAEFIRGGDMAGLYAAGAVRDRASGQVLTRATTGQSANQAQGGFVVINEIDTNIDRVSRLYSQLRNYARVVSIGADTYTRPVRKSGTTAAWASELSARTATDALGWGEISFSVAELYALPVYSQQFLEDSFLNIEAEIAEDAGSAFGQAEAAAFVNGDGVGKPRGFMTAPTAEQTGVTEPAFGTVGFFKTGSDTAFGTSGLEADLFRKLPVLIKPEYLANAAFYMNRVSLAGVMTLKDTNKQYLWQPSLQAGTASTLAGYPVRTLDEMPSIGAGNLPVAFGDMRQFYTIGDRIGIQVLRNPYKTYGQVEFEFRKRTGGAVAKSEAMKFVKTAA